MTIIKTCLGFIRVLFFLIYYLKIGMIIAILPLHNNIYIHRSLVVLYFFMVPFLIFKISNLSSKRFKRVKDLNSSHTENLNKIILYSN